MPECQLPEGRRLSYRDVGVGQPLLLLHGWGMSNAVFTEVETRLALRYRCLSVDFPGHGASAAGEVFSLDSLAVAVEELLQQLALSRPVLLGWSLGGMVAQLVAARSFSRLAGLVLVSSTPCFVACEGWQHGLPDLQLRALRRDLQRGYATALGGFFRQMFSADELPAERFRQIVRFAAGPGRLPDQAGVFAGLEILRQTDLRSLLPAISTPSLVVHGAADRIIPLAAGRFLAEYIAAAQLSVVPGVGHAPFLSQPETFCARLEGFIDEL